MRPGDRVIADGKSGVVAYVIMQAPYYTTIHAVSVVLDEKRGEAGYSGTLYKPEVVAYERS